MLSLNASVEGNFREIMLRESVVLSDAADRTVKAVSEDLKRDTRLAVSGSFGGRVGNTITVKYYLDNRAGGRPAVVGYVHPRWMTKGADGRSIDMLAEFETGATIRPIGAQSLAIPLREAGRFGLGADNKRARLTPETFERRTGLKLRPLRLRNGKTFLVVDNARLTRGGRAARLGTLRGGTATSLHGRATIFVFVLVKMTHLPKRLNIKPLQERALNLMPSRFAIEMARTLR